jgi:hypothetical protein
VVSGLAFILEAAQFGSGAVEVAKGLSAGAIDRVPGGCGGWVQDGIEAALRDEGGFSFGATAKTPGGVDDFPGESDFNGALRGELLLEVPAEGVVEAFFLGANNVARGIETERGRVAGYARFAFDGAGSG